MSRLSDTAFVLIVLAFSLSLGIAVLHLSRWAAARRSRVTRKRIADWEAVQAEREWFMRRFAAVAAMEPEVTATGRRIVAEDLYALPEED